MNVSDNENIDIKKKIKKVRLVCRHSDAIKRNNRYIYFKWDSECAMQQMLLDEKWTTNNGY